MFKSDIFVPSVVGYMEPGFNDQPLEFSGSIRNEPRIIEGDNMSRNDDEGE